MTSKERVLSSIAHRQVDKVPVDLGSSIQSGIHAYAYDNLRRTLGFNSGEIEIMDTYIMAATVEQAVVRELRVDAVPFDVFYGVVGDVVDIMMMHKDMGNMLGPMVDPALGRTIFFPRFKRFVSHVKSRSSYKIMMHNCGSIYEFIPDIIATGIDILNPIQISAKNMKPAKLKREFGKNICFWGSGVDTQRLLPFGSEEDVRRQVRQNARIFADGGGYVFNPVHCVQAGVPARNIIAAFDEINRFVIG